MPRKKKIKKIKKVQKVKKNKSLKTKLSSKSTEKKNVVSTQDEKPEIKIAFDRLSRGGKITMPLEKQFWNATFGQLIDQFGIHWMMNCDHTE